MGQVAAHIASEEISTVAGNTDEISSLLGQLAAYITSEEISTVARNIEEISSMGGAVYCTYCKLGNFPSCCEHRKFPRWLGQVAAHIASEEISTVAGAANFYFFINWNLYSAISIHKMFKSATHRHSQERLIGRA